MDKKVGIDARNGAMQQGVADIRRETHRLEAALVRQRAELDDLAALIRNKLAVVRACIDLVPDGSPNEEDWSEWLLARDDADAAIVEILKALGPAL